MESRIGIRELRQQASAVLHRVAAGDEVEVTDRGRPVARIVPVRPRALDQLVSEGRATEAGGDLLDLLEREGLPLPGVAGRQSPSQALAELRAGER